MTLRLRLILTIGGVAVLMVLPALYAAQQLSRLREIATSVSLTHGAAYGALSGLQNQVGEIGRLQRRYVAVPDESIARSQRDSALASTRLNIRQLQAAGYGTFAERAVDFLDRIESETRDQDVMIARGEPQAATDRIPTLLSIIAEANNLLVEIGAEIDSRSQADLRSASLISATALTTTLLALLACFSIAVLLGTWVTYTLVQPITRLRRSMAAVSAGEFIVPGGLP